MIQARITTLRKPAVGVGNRLARAAQSERTTTIARTTTTRTLGSLLPHPMGSPTKTTKLLHGNRRSIVPAHTHAHGSTTHSLATAHRRSMVTITQTKSTDAPMVSSPAADDDASSLSTTIAPIYVLNEDSKLNVTQSCLNQVERLLRQRRERAKNHDNNDDNNNNNNDNDNDNDGYFLRVYVDAGGCSGFQYQFEVDNDLDEDEDVVVVMAKIDSDGGLGLPRVVVDETSMGFLEGSTIDYVIEMIKSAFVVADNPQSESACGCGSSFAVKNFEKFGARD